MPRVARIVLPGMPHHVTQRGNNRQDVFFVNDDRRVYLEFLNNHADQFDLRVLGYCLMSNHVHIIAIPGSQTSLASAIGRTHFRYTQYVNRMHGRSGHLWQNRFFSCPLDERHCWQALSYVERNPARARIVRLPWRYPWSSAAAHTRAAKPAAVLDMKFWRRSWNSRNWTALLQEHQDDDELTLIRRSTHTGRPLASDRFLSKLEHRIGRRLRPLPLGRPRKKPRTTRQRTRTRRSRKHPDK